MKREMLRRFSGTRTKPIRETKEKGTPVIFCVRHLPWPWLAFGPFSKAILQPHACGLSDELIESACPRSKQRGIETEKLMDERFRLDSENSSRKFEISPRHCEFVSAIGM